MYPETGAAIAEPPAARKLPILLFLVSEDWYFLSHRLPMARAARAAGYEVHVATRVVNGSAAIAAEGFHLHPMSWRRGSLAPWAFLSAVADVRRLYRRLSPDLAHQVALWSSIVGSVAALGLPIRRLSALAGLGFAFTSRGAKALTVRTVLRIVLRRLLDRPGSSVLVQNTDDRAVMLAARVGAERIALIAGSGVDSDILVPLPEPDGPVTVAYVGRLLADKGLRTLIEAHNLLMAMGRPVHLLIAGEPDPVNPASIPQAEIEGWRKLPGITLLGHVADVRTVWADAHIAVLPSRREGLPKSLLEAASCGRPIVATDVPGCREIARAGVNARLVPPDDPTALADAIDALAQDAEQRRRFGAAGRQMIEAEFSSAHIGRAVVALYDRLIGRPTEYSDRSRKAVFFDCDGVLNREPGADGVLRPDDVTLFGGAGAAVLKAQQAGYLTIGITNRSQVARGKVSLAQLDLIFARLQSLLARDGAALDRIYFCPHHPDYTLPGSVPEFAIACECRKPAPMLFKRAIHEMNVDPARSVVIGDSLRDIGAARALGIAAYGVRTGYGCADSDRYPGAAPTPDLMFDNVGDAVTHWLAPHNALASKSLGQTP